MIAMKTTQFSLNKIIFHYRKSSQHKVLEETPCFLQPMKKQFKRTALLHLLQNKGIQFQRFSLETMIQHKENSHPLALREADMRPVIHS